MKIVSEVALISINGTLVVQLLSFLFFLWLINRIMIRPLRQTVEERRFYISRTKDETLAMEKAGVDLVHQMARHETQTRQQGARIREQEEKIGAGEAETIIAAADAEIQRIRHEAEQARIRNRDRVRGEISGLAPELATTIMEKLLERRLAS